MVFSSVPVYLDPSNWQVVQQQPNYEQQHTVPGGIDNYHPAPPPPPPPPPPEVGGGPGLVRPNSMAERARLAKIPQPETALKCPRCESTNTKFCYYNNYNLSQPRHFCKTCRRYWTRGGALRSVPVGGGIRRNKRNKTSSRSSKSCCSATDQQHQTGSSSTTSTTTASSNTSINTNDLVGGHLPPHPQLPFLPSLQYNLTDFASTQNIGFNFGDDLQSQVVTAGSDVDNDQFQNIGDSTNGVGSVLSSGFVEQLRLQQQFPLLANLEPQVGTGLYPFQISTENNIELVNQQLIRSKLPLDYGVTRNSTNVKMEENNNQGLNLSKNFLGSLGINEQYWGRGSGSGSGSGSSSAWTDLSSGFTSS